MSDCRTETSSLRFPAEDLAGALSKRLFSRRGEDGMSALLERLRGHWPKLHEAWVDRRSPDGAKTLGLALLHAANASDRDDLRGLDIRLRTLCTPGLGDTNVCSKIGLALLETLASGDTDSLLEEVQRLAAFDDLVLNHFVNLVSIPLFLDKKQFDAAIAACKKNSAALYCPTSEHLLSKTLTAKKASGVPTSSENASSQGLADRFCSQPFDTISTSSWRGRVPQHSFFACRCATTLPYPIPSTGNDVSVESIWNGEDISEIRRSILDGDFTYCNRTMCHYIVQGTLPKRSEIVDPYLRDIIDNHRTEIDRKPAWVTLGHDPSCNLACPSCRSEIIAAKSEERENLDEFSAKILLPLIADSSANVLISTDGDPFASKHYRRLLHSLDAKRHAGVKLLLLTNGQLFTPKEWEALGHVQKLVSTVVVSIDGARQETYENLRRPGKWSNITANMEFLKQLRQDGKIPSLYLHLVVQEENFEEMVEFVELGKKWKVDGINFIRMINMGTFTTETFQDKDVSDPRHPLHPRLLEILRHPVLHEPQVNLLSLTPLQAVADNLRPAEATFPNGEPEDHSQPAAAGPGSVAAIPHAVRAGALSHDRPDAFGLWKSISQRLRHWTAKGVFERYFTE